MWKSRRICGRRRRKLWRSRGRSARKRKRRREKERVLPPHNPVQPGNPLLSEWVLSPCHPNVLSAFRRRSPADSPVRRSAPPGSHTAPPAGQRVEGIKGNEHMEMRLQKAIADAGVASRRAAEEMIRTGRVTVNGRTVCEMGVKVDPEKDHVKVDGRHLKPAAPKAYVILNKPKDVLTTLEGPEKEERLTIRQCLRGVRH